MKVRIGAVTVALVVGALAAGCGGGGDDAAEQAEQQATPARAIAEIAKVRSGLDHALATYRSGDQAAADEQVGDTYLEHFELVEGPLAKVDLKLKNDLESTIRETLRDRMKAGAAKDDVAQLVQRIEAGLDDAKAALQSH